MEVKATARYIMISPRKVNIIANSIRGYSYPEAVDNLRLLSHKAAQLLLVLIRSARSNANQIEEGIVDADLYIKKLCVDKGPVLKRFRAQAKGRGASRLRRTSNITIFLSK